MKVLSY